MRLIFVCLCAHLFSLACWSQNTENLFDEAHTRRYATYLLESRQYPEAAREYERLLFFRTNDTLVQQFLLESYFKAAQYGTGLQRAVQLYPQSSQMPGSLAFTYGKLLLRNGNHLQLSGLLQNHPRIPAPSHALLQIGHALLTEDWTLAQETYTRYQQIPLIAETYGSLIERSRNLRHKSPLLASSLSLIPGLGKVYAQQWKDGLISFVMIGGLAYTAWRSYQRKGLESPLFWIYGGIGLGFYGGNLYGSWQAAKRYNQRQTQSLIHDTQAALYPRL